MKSAEVQKKSTSTAEHNSFFQKKGKPSFFGENQTSFFNPAPIQTKLTVGEPNDKYEKEADSVADKVVQRLSNPNDTIQNKSENSIQTKPVVAPATISPLVQAKCSSCEHEEKLQKKVKEEEGDLGKGALQKKPIFDSNAEPPKDEDKNVQRKHATGEKEEDKKIQASSNDPSSATNSSSVENSLSSSKNSGNPLPAETRNEMESSFGADFSNVKIHNDTNAAEMSEDLNAQAFTHGNDIYFNAGKYDTHSTEGKHLLAHELTHTVQQKGGLQLKTSPGTNQSSSKTPAPEKIFPTSSGVVDISSGQFLPSEKIKAEIGQSGENGLDVRVIVPKIAREGKIRVKLDRKGNIIMVGQSGYMPVNNPWADRLGGLYLVFKLKDNAISGGFVSIKQKSTDNQDWLAVIKKNADSLGGVGLKLAKLPKPVNEFNGNTYKLGLTDFNVEVGDFVDARFNFTLENATMPKIDALADINVKGVAKGQLKLDNTSGKLKGEASLGIDYKNFNGKVTVKYNEDGSVDIHGKAGYTNDKLSGEIDFVSTDQKSADDFAKTAIQAAGGKNKVKEATEPPVLPTPKEGKKERALAAVGQLKFNLTHWFAGTVNVIVDGNGQVTVIGKIAPPAEIELFKQKDFDKELFHLQVEAGYGIPVVGTIGVFAGVILSAVAYIGPAKMYNIEIEGTYSTDPEIQKSIQISASINISAYAGLRLRAEGGAKLTIVSHDLKIGVGVNADVGVKAYADARPTIGYRDPGEFYISGTVEMVAQPMLGLSGDFFIQLDAPWWSPLDDKKWVWPIGSKEWPLTDPIGLNASMKDYVLGSGVAPDIEFKKPEFDPSKFMTAMVDKQLPEKSAGGKESKSGFKEDGSVPPPEVGDKKDAKAGKDDDPKNAKGGPASKVGTNKPPPTEKDQQEAGVIFKEAAPKLKAIKAPITKADLIKELDAIEKAVKGIQYEIKLDGDKWSLIPQAKGIHSKSVKIAAIVTEEDKKAEGKKGTTDNIQAALSEIELEGKKEADGGEVTLDEAEKIKNKVNADHPSVINISSVKDGGDTWDFDYIQRATKKRVFKKLSNFPKLTPRDLDLRWSTLLIAKLNNDVVPKTGKFRSGDGLHAEAKLAIAVVEHWESLKKKWNNKLKVQITRSPCAGCSPVLIKLKNDLSKDNYKLDIELQPMSDYRGKRNFDENVDLFKQLLEAKIKITPFNVLNELEQFGFDEHDISEKQKSIITRRISQVNEVLGEANKQMT